MFLWKKFIGNSIEELKTSLRLENGSYLQILNGLLPFRQWTSFQTEQVRLWWNVSKKWLPFISKNFSHKRKNNIYMLKKTLVQNNRGQVFYLAIRLTWILVFVFLWQNVCKCILLCVFTFIRQYLWSSFLFSELIQWSFFCLIQKSQIHEGILV